MRTKLPACYPSLRSASVLGRRFHPIKSWFLKPTNLFSLARPLESLSFCESAEYSPSPGGERRGEGGRGLFPLGHILLIAGVCLAASTAPGAVIVDQTFTPSDGVIQEGNLTGQVFTGDFTAAPSGADVLDITVGLNVSGGYNGDMYAYLVAPNGTTDILLNQPGVAVNGFGASGSGMNITFADNSPNGNIQNVTSSSPLTGSYQPASTLGTFNNSSANGDWRLFFADEASGGGNANVNSWSLGITVAPEPQIPAAAYTGLVLAVGGVCWLMRRRPPGNQRPKSPHR